MSHSRDRINLNNQQSAMIHDMNNTTSPAAHQNQGSRYRGTTINRNEAGVRDNVVNGTITIVQEKCKTLVLTLRNAERRYLGFGGLIKPEEDIDRIIDELGDDLTRNVSETINIIQEEVKNARPNENDVDYESKIEVYKELLDYVTNLIKDLTKVFDESLTHYRIRIEQLWIDFQNTSDWQKIEEYIAQFEKDSEKIFTDAIQKHLEAYLNVIEVKLNFFKQCNDPK